jgi:hypothetical protein
MSNKSFAQFLGVAVRTVAYWRKRPEIVPALGIQATLDAVLEHAPARVKAQFAQLVAQPEAGQAPSTDEPGVALLVLVPAEKLPELVAAAGIRPAAYVPEVGAGIGAVVWALAESSSLTVVELDARFIRSLRC